MNKTVLKVINLSVELNNQLILDDLNFNIRSSLITAIIGVSGSGKSTLCRSLVGLIKYNGKLYYNDNNYSSYNFSDLRKKITYIPQIPTAFPGSCAENIIWARKFWGLKTNKDDITNYLSMVGLDQSNLNFFAKNLSVGQLQKLCFARALAIEPEVLILDEPASSMDAISKENFEKIIYDIKSKNPNLTIIIVTHDLKQAKRVANEIILMNKGKIVLQNMVEGFFSELESLTEAEFLIQLFENGGQNHD